MFKIEYLPGASKIQNINGIYKCFAYEDGFIDPNKGGLISVGFKMQVTKEYFIYVFSTKYHGLGGVGDSDYRGIFNIIVFNNTEEVIKYKKGEYVGNISIIRIN
ncbi:deoxyuridine 5'-triphosphate nucleotidohydrolase [Vairimorpha necatrix]|uniref:Deoxyuridine 5'-triphosphate nucleotidohydrolase n=1 Tax=Vairimorpha necatrix TaxID=6039 RepID=A0AAX4JFA4_9MICR